MEVLSDVLGSPGRQTASVGTGSRAVTFKTKQMEILKLQLSGACHVPFLRHQPAEDCNWEYRFSGPATNKGDIGYPAMRSRGRLQTSPPSIQPVIKRYVSANPYDGGSQMHKSAQKCMKVHESAQKCQMAPFHFVSLQSIQNVLRHMKRSLSHFLSPSTGNRRWLPFEVERTYSPRGPSSHSRGNCTPTCTRLRGCFVVCRTDREKNACRFSSAFAEPYKRCLSVTDDTCDTCFQTHTYARPGRKKNFSREN